MFYNPGWLPEGNNNVCHCHWFVEESGLHKTKFYSVFYYIKLTGVSLPIKNVLPFPVYFLP
jgi:hypothetical protein